MAEGDELDEALRAAFEATRQQEQEMARRRGIMNTAQDRATRDRAAAFRRSQERLEYREHADMAPSDPRSRTIARIREDYRRRGEVRPSELMLERIYDAIIGDVRVAVHDETIVNARREYDRGYSDGILRASEEFERRERDLAQREQALAEQRLNAQVECRYNAPYDTFVEITRWVNDTGQTVVERREYSGRMYAEFRGFGHAALVRSVAQSVFVSLADLVGAQAPSAAAPEPEAPRRRRVLDMSEAATGDVDQPS